MVIAVVGLGPRGLVILERMISLLVAMNNINSEVKFLLFDNNGLGGSLVYDVHSDNLLLNTICCQITLYSGEITKNLGPTFTGPSLYEYCKQQNLDADITEFSYLPRSYFYKYMQDFARQQLDRLQDINIRHSVIKAEVIKIDYNSQNDGSILLYTNDNCYKVDQAILCTGHGNKKNQYTKNCWSQILNVDGIAERIIPNQKLLIQGMGLVSFDIISELTESLGGKFIVDNEERLEYIKSGLEPKIYLYSRTGLPLFGKGARHHQIPQHQATHFSIENINAIIEKQTVFDFESDFLPLLLKEISDKYKSMCCEHRFNVDKFFYPHHDISKNNFSEFLDNTIKYLTDDLQAAKEGIEENVFKSACEIIRDLRDNLRLCVEQKRLTTESHKKFLEHYNPIFNKLCVGPPYCRIEQLLALIRANIVSLDIAYNPTVTRTDKGFLAISKFADGSTNTVCADYLIVANIPEVDYLMANSPLWVELANTSNCLFKNQELRIGGVEIDQFSRIANNHGSILNDGLYAFGIPTEGSKYFTYVLPRPDVVSTFLKDANIIAKHIINKLENNHAKTN